MVPVPLSEMEAPPSEGLSLKRMVALRGPKATGKEHDVDGAGPAYGQHDLRPIVRAGRLRQADEVVGIGAGEGGDIANGLR